MNLVATLGKLLNLRRKIKGILIMKVCVFLRKPIKREKFFTVQYDFVFNFNFSFKKLNMK